MQFSVFVHDDHGGKVVNVRGRDAWALLQLMAAGEKGCTPLANPAPRWSGYIYNLRQLGFAIDTIHEHHLGAFPGNHGRYVLRSRVEMAEVAA